MGVHREISCIWNNSLRESVKEFKEEIVDISTNVKTEEIHTYTFSRYNDYKIYTETIYVLISPNTIIFLWSPVAMALFLDTELMVEGGDAGELKPEDSVIFEFSDSSNLDYVGTIFNMKGELFEAFTIKDKVPRKNAKYLFDNKLIDLEQVSIEEEDLMHLSMEFLNYQIEKFNTQIESTISSEDPMPSLEENPFANKYYDHDVIPQEDKKPLGDQNV